MEHQEGYPRLRKLKTEQRIIHKTAEYILLKIIEECPEFQGYAFFNKLIEDLEKKAGAPIIVYKDKYENGNLKKESIEIPNPYLITEEDIAGVSLDDSTDMIRQTIEYIFDRFNEGRPYYEEIRRKGWFKEFKRECLERRVEFKSKK